MGKHYNTGWVGPASFSSVDLSAAVLASSVANIAVLTPVLIDSFSATAYRSAEYLLQFTQGTAHTLTKLLLVHDGTDVSISEYGSVEIGTPISHTLAASFSLGNLELTVACSTANVTPVSLKFSRVLFDV